MQTKDSPNNITSMVAAAIMFEIICLICVNSKTWQVSQVLEMVDELKRYPLLILLDQNKCYEELSLLNSLFTNYVPRNDTRHST